jgi:hypothetical protein
MQEVRIRIRFVRECLGSIKRRTRGGQTIFRLLRDSRNRVMFLPTWWAELMRYAATVANLGQRLVRQIDWDPIVSGHPREDWRRTVVAARDDPRGRRRYAVHEAFPPGSTIAVRAVLPSGLTPDDLRLLLEVAGTYRGISPFQDAVTRYGTFEVCAVTPVIRDKRRTRARS